MTVLDIFLLLLVIFSFIGCQSNADDSFHPYQTFDEFSMREGSADIVAEPYLLIQRKKDTIKIVRTDQSKDTMVYLNMGTYWFSSIRIDYKYTLFGKLNKHFSPLIYGIEYTQVDVYRYFYGNKVVEAFFHFGDTRDINEMGLLPDFVSVSTPNATRSYTFLQNLDQVLDSTLLGNTCIWQIYQKRKDTLSNDTSCIVHHIYDYDACSNTLYKESMDYYGEIAVIDSFQLNALGLYHIPTYAFSIDEGKYHEGIFDEKMGIKISCTTLEKTISNITQN